MIAENLIANPRRQSVRVLAPSGAVVMAAMIPASGAGLEPGGRSRTAIIDAPPTTAA